MVREPTDDTTRPQWILLGLLVGAFTVLGTCLASWKAASLMPEWGFDLSFFHNLVWNVSEGNGYRQSSSYHEPAGIFNESHFEPIIVLAAPLYKLVPRLETVFAVQSALLGLGGLGIFRIARSAGASAWAALGGAAIYLLWWPLWRMAMADIRPLLWCIPFLILLVAALRENRRREALVWAGLACLCREEVPVLVVFTALGALLWRVGDRKERGKTVLLLAGGVALFSLVTYFLRRDGAPTFYIRPLDWLKTFFGAPDVDGQMSNYGHSPGDLLGVRLGYLREWLLPAAVGALLAPEVLLASAPLFLYLFTQSDEWASWEGSYVHWTAPALALAASAAALGWTRLLGHDRVPRALTFVFIPLVLLLELAVIFGHPGMVGGEGSRSFGWDSSSSRWERYIAAEIAPWREQQPHVVEAHRLAARVPADAAVLVDDGRGDRQEQQASPMHLLSGRAHHYSYQQPWMDDDSTHDLDPGADQLTEALLPPACCEVHPCPDPPPSCPGDPTWAMIHRADHLWLRRARAAGLVDLERGNTWILLGPPPEGVNPPVAPLHSAEGTEQATASPTIPTEQPSPAVPADEPTAPVP